MSKEVRYREVAHLLAGMGDMLAKEGNSSDALTLWTMAGKYKRMANELRADLPDGNSSTSPHT